MDDKKTKLIHKDDKKTKLILKALTDAAFMKQLRSNPNATIEKATGVKIPTGVTISVVEDTESVVHLVLPFAGLGESRPTDKELEKTAGGVAIKQTMLGRCSDDSTTYQMPCGT